MTHVKQVCRPGAGNACCSYLLMPTEGPGGFTCAKWPGNEEARAYFSARREARTMVAQGDNCDGEVGL